MAVLSLLHFGILLIAQVSLGIPWSAKPAARYEGYDLERGPVLYEAYYPEEQDIESPSPDNYQEKRYFDHISVPERSYQIPADPYELPYDSEETEIHEEYIRPKPGQFAAFTRARPQTVQKKDYVTLDRGNEEYIFADEPENRQPRRDDLKSTIGNDYSFAGSQSNTYENRNGEDSDFVKENRMNYGGQDVQRIVPIDDEFIFGEEPIEKVPELKDSFGNSNKQEVFEVQNFGGDNIRGEQRRSLPMENIFEPRPQTINYVFSTPKKANNLKAVRFEPETEDNDWPRSYGDNLIQAEIKKADEQELKKQEAKVASIKVSQVSHHKIRHHHGERPKRNYVHH